MYDDGEIRDDDESRVEHRRTPKVRAAIEIEEDMISKMCRLIYLYG